MSQVDLSGDADEELHPEADVEGFCDRKELKLPIDIAARCCKS